MAGIAGAGALAGDSAALHADCERRLAAGLERLPDKPEETVAATLAAETGAGVKEIMYRIGHSSPQAALRYQHATQRRDRSIADGISRLITHQRPDDGPPEAKS